MTKFYNRLNKINETLYTKNQLIVLRIIRSTVILSFTSLQLIFHLVLHLSFDFSLLYAAIIVFVIYILLYGILPTIFIKRNRKKDPEQFNKEKIREVFLECYPHKKNFKKTEIKNDEEEKGKEENS